MALDRFRLGGNVEIHLFPTAEAARMAIVGVTTRAAPWESAAEDFSKFICDTFGGNREWTDADRMEILGVLKAWVRRNAAWTAEPEQKKRGR